jgi:hypothetical protein
VTSALNTVNALNTTLGALPGTNVAISGNTTINASNGTFSASGTGYTNVRVFNVTNFSLNNGQTLVINGDANGDSVVLNSTSNENFSGNVVLTGGLTPDNVIFNFVGGSNLSGGPTLKISSGVGTTSLAQGIFLNPNGTVSIGSGNVLGRVFGGDSHDFQFNGPGNLTAPGGSATPTLTTTPIPTAVTLPTGPPGTVTLKDAATLSGGTNPTGTITFFLFFNGGSTPVHTETVTVSGDGTYTTPTGYTLPSDGSTVTGTYEWDASYSGDSNNDSFADFDDAAEQVTVSAASPTLVTAASPTGTVQLGNTAPTLTDSATLSGGYYPGGSITFTLSFNNGSTTTTVYTDTVTVSGNGTYTTSQGTNPGGWPLPNDGSKVTGTYTWTAHYAPDGNNNAADDQGGAAEQVTFSPAQPTLVTSSGGNLQLVNGTATLTDTATLSGAYIDGHVGGSITFTLDFNGVPVPGFSVVDPVTQNGTYSASFTLPTTGTVTGTYTWHAHYSGDPNNNPASDQGGAAEQQIVSPAQPTLVTTASPAVTLPSGPPGTVPLTDTATLSGAYIDGHVGGSVTFTLTLNGAPVAAATQTDQVSGNGTYTASYTLPTAGTVAGTYTWHAVYSGDANNVKVSDSDPVAEQVTVSPAGPTLVTSASPSTVTLPAPVPTALTDTADLTGGFAPTGSIVFTLTGPNGFSYTQTDQVSGNGTYSASATLPTAGTVAGTYTWTARYGGDVNNIAASDQGGTAEQTLVSPAQPTLVTTASPNVTLPTAPRGR